MSVDESYIFYIFADYEWWLCVEVSQPDWNLTVSRHVRVLEDQT